LEKFLEDLLARAAQETGMTVEELLAKADSLPSDAPSPVARPDRDTLRRARCIPELHLRNVFDRDPEPCAALERVRDFLRGRDTLLVLAGGVGTRKSGCAAWALTERPGLFIASTELARIAVSRKDDETERFRAIRSKYPLVVIDDVGAEYDTEWFRSVLNDVVNARYEEMLKTILTTNLEAKGFADSYGKRILDRVNEAGAYQLIGGTSLRKRR
jgi:DNA replication protein DnaC